MAQKESKLAIRLYQPMVNQVNIIVNNLTIDGTQVVNNDNNHGMTLVSGTKFLRRGVKSFSIQYAQTGSGNYGLELKAGGAAIDGIYYAH